MNAAQPRLAARGLLVAVLATAAALPVAVAQSPAPVPKATAQPAPTAKPASAPARTAPAAKGATRAPVELVASVAVLEGTFDNARQLASLPKSVARKPTPGKRWVDPQYARFVRFPAPLLGEVVYYLEWRAGAPDAPITRQRVWAFSDTKGQTPRMRFYTLDEPGLWAAGAADTGVLAQLSRAGLHEYPPGCELLFRRAADGRLEGRIPEGACQITARESKRTMQIDAAITLGRDGFEYDEAGTLDDGRKAFLVPEGHRYRFERVPAR